MAPWKTTFRSGTAELLALPDVFILSCRVWPGFGPPLVETQIGRRQEWCPKSLSSTRLGGLSGFEHGEEPWIFFECMDMH